MRKNSSKGFNLLELMITMAITVILMSVAIPAYQSYTKKTHRTDATTSLQNAANEMNSCFYEHTDYTHADCPEFPQESRQGYYELTLVSTRSTFTLTATPKAGGPMVHDAKCTSFSIDQAEAQDATGTDTDICW